MSLAQEIEASKKITPHGSENSLDVDSHLVLKFDKELKHFRAFRAELLKTPWGKKLQHKVLAVRKLAAFSDLQHQWYR
jgi:hypothetical protein